MILINYATQFTAMLKLQEELNVLMIDKDWRLNKRVDFRRAVTGEIAEMYFDHFKDGGAKWWKPWFEEVGTAEIEQLQIEVIDLLHFELAEALWCVPVAELQEGVAQSHSGPTVADWAHGFAQAMSRAEEQPRHKLTKSSILRAIDGYRDEALAPQAVFDSETTMYTLCYLAFTLNMTPESMFSTYISKAVLNKFRTLNGQGAGTYSKFWTNTDGVIEEDNVVLARLLADPKGGPDLSTVLYDSLSELYNVSLAMTAQPVTEDVK